MPADHRTVYFAMAILTLLLPLFLLTSFGWLLSKRNWFSAGWQQSLSDVCAKLLFPCLLFAGTYKTGIPDEIPRTALLTFYLPVVVLFTMLFFIRFRHTDRSVVALAANYSNNVFIGVPLLTRVLGVDSLRFAFPVIAFHSLLVFLLYYVFSAFSPHRKGAWHHGLRRSVQNPIVLSLLSGLLFNYFGWHLPEFIEASLQMLGQATLPLALLVLGASLSGLRLNHLSSTLLAVICKTIVLPASVFLLCHFVFLFRADLTAVLVLMSACPVGINAFPVAQNNGDRAEIVSSAILLSTLLCVLTLPLWVALVWQG